MCIWCKVLYLLFESDELVKVYDLFVNFDGEGVVKLLIVYCVFDFFQDMGFVYKIESLNVYVVCGYISYVYFVVFVICDLCGLVEELYVVEISVVFGNEM